MKIKNVEQWENIKKRIDKASKNLENTFIEDSNKSKKILKQRAKKLAAKEIQKVVSETSEFTLFSLAGETYAFESTIINEVYPLKNLTPVPNTPSFIIGIVNIRGKIISVMDIKIFLRLPSKGFTDLTRVIVISSGEIKIGILAEEVTETIVIELNKIKKPPSTLKGKQVEYLKGVTSNRIIVLDAEKLLNDKNIIVNHKKE